MFNNRENKPGAAQAAQIKQRPVKSGQSVEAAVPNGDYRFGQGVVVIRQLQQSAVTGQR